MWSVSAQSEVHHRSPAPAGFFHPRSKYRLAVVPSSFCIYWVIWLLIVDTSGTLRIVLSPEVRAVFESIRQLGPAAQPRLDFLSRAGFHRPAGR